MKKYENSDSNFSHETSTFSYDENIIRNSQYFWVNVSSDCEKGTEYAEIFLTL